MTQFKTNDRVEVIKPGLMTYGSYGRIKSVWYDGCDVLLDSGKALYYAKTSLEKVDNNERVKKGERQDVYYR